ncbi:ATP-binding protein [Paraburkholderia sp. SIMBA_054]|uniref:ATP-binding protein n=1 Tax=Paraburkholderia sp. SIMBA_054 TaxID=3085795 RepID=UPI00397C0C5D
MQVADIQGEATAATLGAQKTTAMAMVQDASFLMMLSTNLYSNQQLACIREVLCNAWDAHIESGMTHVPVKVTITAEGELVIEDSGYGIPEDMFEAVYGTFGGSTKRTNKAVTGGFGLGCKSPWAYTESFRVISENQGKKVIYNLVRASVEADGLPAITRVMEMPTERSGLTVRFQLREADVRTMKHYIHYVAMHGDMLVDLEHQGTVEALTGEPMGVERLERINLDTTPGSYDVDHEKWHTHYMGQHKLYVRYGAVIYPMLETPGTQKAVDLLKEFMEMVGFRKMVVQAAPGTLALTPNRESLSSSRMTEDGITDLCVALVARIEEDLIRQIPGSIQKACEYLEKGEYHSTLTYYKDVREAITPDSVRRYLASQLGVAKYTKYLPLLNAAEHRGFKKIHVFTNKAATVHFQKLRRRIKNCHWSHRVSLEQSFLRRYVMRPLSRVFQAHPQLLKQKEMEYAGKYFYDRDSRTHWLDKMPGGESFPQLAQLVDNPIVFITQRTRRLKDSINDCPFLTFGSASWVYKIAPKDQRKDAIIEAFKDHGYQVVDLTLNHDWDDAAHELLEQSRNRSRDKAATATLPGIAGKRTANALISLTSIYHADGTRKMGHGSIKLLEKEDVETTDEPLFYLEVGSLAQHGGLGAYGNYLDLTDDERKRAVVVRTGTEKNMAIKRGAVEANKYLARKMWDRVHSKEYQDYCTKQRRDALFDQYHAHPDHLELLDYLGIRLPGLDKLVNNPQLEQLRERVEHVSGSAFLAWIPELTMDQLTHYSEVIQKYQLVELPAIKKLKALRQDPLMQRLFSGSHTLEWIKKYPDRKAAIKSLVMSAIKNGN